MADIFHFVEKPYILKNNSIIQRQTNRTVYFGLQSIYPLLLQIMGINSERNEKRKIANG